MKYNNNNATKYARGICSLSAFYCGCGLAEEPGSELALPACLLAKQIKSLFVFISLSCKFIKCAKKYNCEKI